MESTATRTAWSEIGGKGSGDLVLAVDFTATGRPDARFADLVELSATDRPVWESMPQAIATDIGPGGAVYLDRWTEEIRADGRRVGAVLGFCAGAVFAAELADRIAAWQDGAPRLLLFDPEKANAVGLYWQFHQSIALFEGILGADAVARAGEAGRTALDAGDGLRALGTTLVTLFKEVSEPAFEQLDLDEEDRAEFTDSFTAFVAYVVAADELPAQGSWAKATAFSSATPHSGLNPLRDKHPDGVAGPAGIVARELRFDCDHPDLLRDPEAAKAFNELIADGE
ncbi:hypothetical protein AB0N81_02195 [Streptomyces sp. NPDC093510]|uniref:hypothetical protein n=1 Tax=Streptomyces sp. NPDC093510 TaxID=3155199 RepID=UPI00341DD2FA